MKRFLAVLVIVAVISAAFVGCAPKAEPLEFTGSDYTIKELDLSVMPDELKGTKYEYLYQLTTVDDSRDYMAHRRSFAQKRKYSYDVSGRSR